MIPLRDENPRKLFPGVTIAIIVANVLVFLYQVSLPKGEIQSFLFTYGAVPNLIVRGSSLYAIFTSMFLHGGFMHLLGNMWYLWIFGDNVEGLMGHWRFILFYLLCGTAAFFGHFIFEPTSTIPMVGASGAISGVLGAYALRYPRARVHLLIPLFPFVWLWRVFLVPAAVVLGGWFVIQLFSGIAAQQSGVAWFAHVGGFVAGLLLVKFFEPRPKPPEKSPLSFLDE